MLKLKLQYFGHLMWRTDSFEKTPMLGKIEGRRRRGNRGWDGWMASPTQWTCEVKVAQSCLTLCNPMDGSPPDSSVHGDCSGKNTGVGCHALLQGIFPTQGLNAGLRLCRQILYQLSHKGSPRILELVAYPFSRGSSRLRNRTGISCIARGFFTSWATREAKLQHEFRNYAAKVRILRPRWWSTG